jgi:hypothetical protein
LDTLKSFESQIYTVNHSTFTESALRLFRFQAENNIVYKNFISHLRLHPEKIHSLEDIPFMPISFFKQHQLKSGSWPTDTTFTSSGTTGAQTSAHHLYSLPFYLNHAEKCFEHFFGKITGYHFLALLPSYLERQQSSLVAMLDYFIRKSGSPHSGFYLHNVGDLLSDLDTLRTGDRKVMLWGVTFALLELAENTGPDLGHCLVFETGGMKGRRREMTRSELHTILTEGLHVPAIHSEYGMTELLSQCYTAGHERFYCPPWVKIIGRDLADPFAKGLYNETAGINVIDLANWHSIAFIETEDLGKVFADGSFEVLGRMDNSDIRGCNLLIA